MFLSRNKLWAATHALLFDKFGDLRDGSTSLKPGVRVHSAVFPLARAKRLQRTAVALERPGCNRASVLGRQSPPATLNSTTAGASRPWGASKEVARHVSNVHSAVFRIEHTAKLPNSAAGWATNGIRNIESVHAMRIVAGLYIHGTLSGTPGVRCPLGVFPGKGVPRPTTAPRSRQCGPPPSGPGGGRGATKPLGSTHPVTADSLRSGLHPPGSFSPHAILSSAAVPFSPGCAYAAGGRHRAPAAGGALALRNIESGHGGVCSLAAYPRSLFPGARLLGACSAPGSGTVLAATRAPAVGAARLPGHRIRPCQVRRCRLRHLGSFLARWR